MRSRPRFWLAILGCCGMCLSAALAENSQQQKLDRQYQEAVAQYDAGHFAEAISKLEVLLPFAPDSFEMHELLGLSYASQSNDSQAILHLTTAVRLKPNAAAARTNLAASLAHAGKMTLAGEQFKKALELEPGDYDANHNLAEFYLQAGKLTEALPLLKTAQQIRPNSYDNGYDLALADSLTGQLAEARQLIQTLLQQKDTGELHNLLGQVEEKDGHFVAAVNQFHVAAHMDPSDDNLFDWGSELLLHRTYEPAIDVFKHASQRYPKSPRLLIGLGMSLYSLGKYDEAVEALLSAADLDPTDARCYLFLSKAYDSSPALATGVIDRFKRYAQLQPENALAQYYYAMSLWKGKRTEDATVDLKTVESLLKQSISLNDRLPEAHVQLGNLYADQHSWEKSIPEYVRALELNPMLPDAHYRLGQDYVHVGKKDDAQAEFDIYQKQRAQHMAEIDKERAEVQQFVIAEKNGSAAKQ